MTITTLKPRKRIATVLDFVPVIFANGRDDDLPGIVAAFKDERVQYGKKIYKPGEPIIIHNQTLCMSCNFVYITNMDDPIPDLSFWKQPILIIRKADNSRYIEIKNCEIWMNWKAGA